VVNQGADGPRALLSVEEALKIRRHPGTIFLGLRDGAAVFGMGISAAAVEKLLTHKNDAVTECAACDAGVVPPDSSRRSRWRNRWSTGISARLLRQIAEPVRR